MSKIRWRIAYRLNRSPRFCWADLVEWAMDGRHRGGVRYRFRENLWEPSRGAQCRAESLTHRDRACYCGKFRDGCWPPEGGA